VPAPRAKAPYLQLGDGCFFESVDHSVDCGHSVGRVEDVTQIFLYGVEELPDVSGVDFDETCELIVHDFVVIADRRSAELPTPNAAIADILRRCKVQGIKRPATFALDDGEILVEWASAKQVTSVESTGLASFLVFDLDVESRVATEIRADDIGTALAWVASKTRGDES
jgi:hypothetical protein